MNSRLRALRVVHPFPSFLNAALVLALAVVAGAGLDIAAVLAVGMLGIQFCIGTVNDLVDVDLDSRTKAWKPVPSGLISIRAPRGIAAASAATAAVASATHGPLVLLMA